MQVVLADDHAMVREALLPFIRRVGDNVTVMEADTFHDAIQLAQSADDLGLIILDLMMPGMNDIVGVRRMHELYPDVPTVILSGSVNTNTIMRTIKNGAAGFIPKTYGGQALVSALKLVLSGERYIPSSMFLDEETSQITTAASGPSLTTADLNAHECETLELLKDGNTNKEIARMLGVQEVTVKKRLGRIYRKLGVSNRTQATRIALELGLNE